MFKNVDIMTAMVTPFNDQNQVDNDRLKKLIEHLILTGSKGILVNGTTGESPTLSEEEKISLIKETVSLVNGRVPIMAGTGSNNTMETIRFTNEVANISGVDAALVVVPYYNKPNQKGMIAHFETIASATELPIFIYNIPGRTGVTMSVETIVKLSANKQIVGIKDCTGSENLSIIIEQTPDDFFVYTGEDADSLTAKVLGANGVISVASHIFGNEMTKMYRALSEGNIKLAGDIQRELTPKMVALFALPSPGPAKAALNYRGIHVGDCRLPIQSLTKDETKQLIETLKI
ncbi:4-hydroxy-tetrahydrodipicolinate synthase [Dellaglioa algida]|uniref:4-hydroxy-tetrahydrodipicolinate synthase n=2 Tax=Dellaglioa algida TaxID=105612 RepID=A0A0R1HIT8_9LACO|nr:4-hydroxy-tetrahydrodipicolinate synthase [Dellaglioa algida]KRK46342.1 dihydrodipicolinate synthase [Dellaglioa algida DSM 15638]MDK1716345.1 4-hydroxy-tetrahydrodipicolinate synthase [Dellaglioa algida]MDK1720301.1 4-hydroxy-tetrahydrodipicolinate synthase [Dellaglioa algida]MDK1721286.1 4-hydroxy-tetrahydrodipicolinate synthase [Dellaglioa algida]MDK1723442.1 4-hydroxy-tetrahydrodipicolinate synthase [Dellaglioa algida]